MSDLPTFTATDVADHKDKTDLWITMHGKVYNVSEYVRDHPGGADVLIEVAGADATAAYEDVGHSEDADEILENYLIGYAAEGDTFQRPKTIALIQQTSDSSTKKQSDSTISSTVLKAVLGSALLGTSVYSITVHGPLTGHLFEKLPLSRLTASPGSKAITHNPVFVGFAAATSLYTIAAYVVGRKLSQLTNINSGFTQFPPHRKQHTLVQRVNPHMMEGFLNPKEYKDLKVDRIDKLSPNVYRYVFKLPNASDVVGLPIGQHVAIKATIDGRSVSRSYTPTSNNLDAGILTLVIKLYPDGELTGKYFANLNPGDTVLFRGPKGPMKYQRGLCKNIGMIAGGTGITPMFQLIRAICEDDRDTTQVSLIFANHSEEDIILRKELDIFATKYPGNFKVWYMLDQAPDDWAYGKGYVTPDVIEQKLPCSALDTKMMLCGPPGLVAASKKTLVSMGFQEPGSIGKMTDDIFCF